MKNKLIKMLTLGLCLTTLTVSCDNDKGSDSAKVVYDNETTPLVFSTQDLDNVFNPFYYSTGPDGQIVGMTQISMFTTDKEGKITYGKDEPVVVLDYEDEYNSEKDETTYTFVLKNPEYNVRYSNGSYVTMRDVLFNLYEYLDPQYAGSSTMYSTKIVGLQEYRTQQDHGAAQDAFEQRFTNEANNRVNQLITVIEEIREEHKDMNISSEDFIKVYLPQKAANYAGNSEYKYASKFVDDFKYVSDEFKKELENDFKANSDEDTYKSYDLSSPIQAFFYAEGLISIDLDKDKTDPTRIDFGGWEQSRIDTWNDGTEMTQQQAIDIVYESYFPDSFATIASAWQTASTIRETFSSEAKDEYFANSGDVKYKSISGIKVLTEDITINNKQYKYALYNSDGTKYAGNDNGYEILSITIEGVDPKAIWNFSFSVAPMYYYSNEEQIAKFNYGLNLNEDPHFGVEYGSRSFQLSTIKGGDKVGLPMGAGAYKATTKYTEADKVTGSTFCEDNICYFERNDYFLMGKPKIKLIRYKVVAANQMLNALRQGEVHYCEPNAKPEIISELNTMRNQGFSYAKTDTLGYGYIGINPKYVPNVNTRRALMSVMNTKLCLDYYSGEAEVLYRPMSKVSWAYPREITTAYYEYDATAKTAREYLLAAGYTQNSQGKMVDKDGKQLKLTFTISGQDDDHPVTQTFLQAQTILNNIGCDITVKPDVDALSKLNTGDLAVWAAAWSTTIDPDMYQTYHKRSQATSTKNWGYDVIDTDSTGKYSYEKGVIADLSEKIEKGRETLVESQRKAIYKECLDLVMDLAVELPTYQRKDLFAYNVSVLDESTMTPSDLVSPYNGPINQIWNLSLVTK